MVGVEKQRSSNQIKQIYISDQKLNIGTGNFSLYPLSLQGAGVFSDADSSVKIPFSGTIKRLVTKTRGNDLTQAVDIFVRINSVNSLTTTQHPNATNDERESLVNTSFEVGDVVVVLIQTGGGSGTVDINMLVEVEYNG